MASSSQFLLRPTAPPPTLLRPIISSLLKPPSSSVAATTTFNSCLIASYSAGAHFLRLPLTHTFSSPSLPLRHCYTTAAASHTPTRALSQHLGSVGDVSDDDGGSEEIEGTEEEEELLLGAGAEQNDGVGGSDEEEKAHVLLAAAVGVGDRKQPELSVKEKKELASYARSLGDKLKSQQVGKSGVTANTFLAFNETLEANELLKLKVHNTCPGELEDVVKLLEQGTASVAVSQIGRTIIFYRPSLSKMKAVEKKRQARVSFQRAEKSKPLPQGRERQRGKFSMSSSRS